MAYSFSKTWVSEEARELEKFQNTKIHLEYICRKSPFIPTDLKLWLEHRTAIAAARSHRLARLVAAKEETNRLFPAGPPTLLSPFKGKVFLTNRSTILCEFTIWCPNHHMKPEMAPWPSSQEFKWEGDDRAATDNGRFLPLPRNVGNATVAWHHIPLVYTYPFDVVRKIPTEEDIIAPVDEIEKKDISTLINGSLWREMNSDVIF